MDSVEMVEFYPLTRNEEKEILTGTLRIKLSDLGIHILGIYVSKRKESWFFSLPGRRGVNHKNGEPVHYPFFVFEDREKQRGLIDIIRKKGPPFIEKRLADTENPLSFPQDEQRQPIKESKSGTPEKKIEKEQKPDISPAIKEWSDPPPRKTATARSVSKFARR